MSSADWVDEWLSCLCTTFSFLVMWKSDVRNVNALLLMWIMMCQIMGRVGKNCRCIKTNWVSCMNCIYLVSLVLYFCPPQNVLYEFWSIANKLVVGIIILKGCASHIQLPGVYLKFVPVCMVPLLNWKVSALRYTGIPIPHLSLTSIIPLIAQKYTEQNRY